jgi:hypothetical protein
MTAGRAERTITLPAGLARALMQAAYWPSIQADLMETMGPRSADLAEGRQDDLDAWLLAIGKALSPDFTSDRMLESVTSAWMQGSRPGVAR